MIKSEAVAGVRVGRLTIVDASTVYVVCKCDCGEVRSVYRPGLGVHTMSCGCLAREKAAALGRGKRIHGHAAQPGARSDDRSSEYIAWQSMRMRCQNPSDANYARYGGRGIVVCDRWRDSFVHFLSDMGLKPSPRHSLDRIDNDGNYEPSNCRWTTIRVQSRNRRSNHLITIDDRTQCVTDWAKESGLSVSAIITRHKRGLAGAAILRPSQRTHLSPSQREAKQAHLERWLAQRSARPSSHEDDGAGWPDSMSVHADGCRVTRDGYLMRMTPNGPRSEHSIVWTRAHGPVPPGLEIHHINENRADNRLDNLQLLTKLAHKRIHSGCTLVDGVWWKPCSICGERSPITTEHWYLINGTRPAYSWCRACHLYKESAQRRLRRARPVRVDEKTGGVS